MRTEVRNQIKMLGYDVSAEVAAGRATHRRWLRLGPTEHGVLLVEVEVPLGVDPTEYANADEDNLTVSSEPFPSLEDAVAALTKRGVDTDTFDAIWKSDNPF